MKTLLSLLVCALACSASAKIITKPVSYEHAGARLDGFLVYDDSAAAESKRPGVLVIPEWWGLNDYIKGRAQQLAQMGYVVFAADMYGGGVNTTDAKKAQELSAPFHGKPLMAERARAGLDELLKSGLVDERKVAAIGFCFGGSSCQALAFSGAPLVGIVSFHGGLVQPSPEVLQKTHAKFLMLNGAIDPTIKSDDIAAFMKALDGGHIDYQFINYAGALHAFSNPDATKLAQANNATAMIGYNEVAARRSWSQMKLFFDEIFSGRE